MQIVNSPLVKTAIYGEDPNWGRVLAAAGKDSANKLNPNKVDLFFGSHQLLKWGEVMDYNGEELETYLKNKNIIISLNLHLGKGHAVGWGCDLTHGYIDINTQYN
jgi:glutamate N-acetyltransferase / amino-acid N-acetyltransferase